MRRLLLLALAAAVIGGLSSQAGAERKPRPTVLAVLSSDAPYYTDHLSAFERAFQGKVVRFTAQAGDKAFSERIASTHPDLILAVGGRAAKMTAELTDHPPVLFTMVYDPAAYGLVAGPAMCGLSLEVDPAQRFEALAALKPGARGLRVGLLHSPAAGEREVSMVEKAARAAGHELTIGRVADRVELGPELKQILSRVDVLWLLAEPEVVPDEDALRLVLREALDKKVMVAGISEAHVRAGALFAVSADYLAEGGRAAEIAKDIIGGKSPESVGIQAPANVIWSVNTKVAEELGLELAPVPTLKRFQRVYP